VDQYDTGVSQQADWLEKYKNHRATQHKVSYQICQNNLVPNSAVTNDDMEAIDAKFKIICFLLKITSADNY